MSFYQLDNGEERITVNSIKSPVMQRKQINDPGYQKVTVSSGNNQVNHFAKNNSDSSDSDSIYGVVSEEIIMPDTEIGLSGERSFEEIYGTESDESNESIHVGDTVMISGKFGTGQKNRTGKKIGQNYETEQTISGDTENIHVGDNVHMTIGLQSDNSDSTNQNIYDVTANQKNDDITQYHVGDNINFSINVNGSAISDSEKDVKILTQTPTICIDQCSSRNSYTESEASEPAYEEQEFDIVLKKSTRIEPSNKKHLKRLIRDSDQNSNIPQATIQQKNISQNENNYQTHLTPGSIEENTIITPGTNVTVNIQPGHQSSQEQENITQKEEPIFFESVTYQSSDEGSIKSYTQFSDDDSDTDISTPSRTRKSSRKITLSQNRTSSPDLHTVTTRESPEIFETQTRFDSPEIFEIQTVETSSDISKDDVDLLVAPELHNHERRSSLNYIPIDIEIEKDTPGHCNVTVAPNSDDEYETSHHVYRHYEVHADHNDSQPKHLQRPASNTASLSTATSYETVDVNVDLVDIYKKTKNLSFAKSNVLKQVRMKAMVLQKMRKHAKEMGEKSLENSKSIEYRQRKSPDTSFRRHSSDNQYKRRSPDHFHRRESPEMSRRRRSPDSFRRRSPEPFRRRSPDSFRKRSPDSFRRPSPDSGHVEYRKHSQHKESYYDNGKSVEHESEYHREYRSHDNYDKEDYTKYSDHHYGKNDRRDNFHPKRIDFDHKDDFFDRKRSMVGRERQQSREEKKFQSDFKSRQEIEIKNKNEIEKNSYEAFDKSVNEQHHVSNESSTHAQSHTSRKESTYHHVEERRTSEQTHKRHHSFHDRQRSKSVVASPHLGTFQRNRRPSFTPSYPNSPSHDPRKEFSPKHPSNRNEFPNQSHSSPSHHRRQSSPSYPQHFDSPSRPQRRVSSPSNSRYYDSPSRPPRRASSPTKPHYHNDSPSSLNRRASLPAQRRGSLPSNQYGGKQNGRSPAHLNHTFNSPSLSKPKTTRSLSATSTPNMNRKKDSKGDDSTSKSTPEIPKPKTSNPNAIMRRTDEDSGIKKPERKSDDDVPGGLPAFLAKGSANHNAWSQVLNMFQGNQKQQKSETAISQSTSKAKNAFLAARHKRAQMQQQLQQQAKIESEKHMELEARREREMQMAASQEQSHMATSSSKSQMQQQNSSHLMSSAVRSRKFSTFGSVVQKIHRTSSSQKTSKSHMSSSHRSQSHYSRNQSSSHSIKSRQEYARSLRESSYRGISERRIRARSNWKWAFDKIVHSIRESKHIKHETARNEAVRVEAKGKSITLVFDEEDKKGYQHETDNYYFGKKSKLHRSHSFSNHSSHYERKDLPKHDRHLRRTPSIEDFQTEGKSKLQLVREGYKHIPSEYVYYTVCTRYFHPENNDWIENIHRLGRVKVPSNVYHAERCVFWHDLYEPDRETMQVSKIIPKKKKHRRSKSVGSSPQPRRKKSDDVPIMYGSHSETTQKSSSRIQNSSGSHLQESSRKSESKFYRSNSTRMEQNSFHAEASNMAQSHTLQTTMVY